MIAAAFRCLLLAIVVIAAVDARAAEPAERMFALAIVNGAVAPEMRVLRAVKNERVRLVIACDTACVIHLHGYNLEARVPAGGHGELTLIAKATGRFAINRHDAAESPAGHRHDKALAHLEVRSK
jgi:hypothetical protein